jgi:phosphoribosyl 1,2-cyclic phosphodiesterase
MTLTFLGTRANIPIRSRLHRRHSMMMVSGRRGRLIIDCGADWLGHVARLGPSAILVTHGHPDHAAGLKRGAPCPVYATARTCRAMARWPRLTKRTLSPGRPVRIAGFDVEAWPVAHSVNAPAVGFKITANGMCVFYAPDVARLIAPDSTMAGVDLYIGDGSVLNRPLVRRRGRSVIGHASVAEQLEWCRAAGVRRAVFSHCGSGIVRSEARGAEAAVGALGRGCGVDARLAHDGLKMRMVRRPPPTAARADTARADTPPGT